MLLTLRTIVTALVGIFFVLIGAFGMSVEHVVAPSENVPNRIEEVAPPTSTPNKNEAAAKTATSTLKESKTAEEIPAPAAAVEATPIPPTPTLSATVLNEKARSAIVNILCVANNESPVGSMSATGVVIDPHGIILTNAHVAQHFLLKDYPHPRSIDCTIRTGSPAQATYRAELLFFPPSWIANNAQKILDIDPLGNGEHDYALLRITTSIRTDTPLPEAFPSLSLATRDPILDETSLVAAYPAGFLGSTEISRELYQQSSLTSVKGLYTFAVNTPDLFSIGGTVVAQRGSSGGVATNGSGALLGLIVTSTDAPETGNRDLRAISAAYIARDFENETNTPLASLIYDNTAAQAALFQEGTARTLTQKLIDVIEKRQSPSN